LREIEISDEKEIDKILSEPEYQLNFVQSILQQKMVTVVNIDQQTTLPLQKQTTPDALQEPVKSKSKKVGKKKSTVSSAKKKTSKKTVAEDEIIQIVEQLKNTNSREEARNLIPNEYTVDQLKVLAKQLGVSIPPKIKKDDLIEKIIQDTIGYRIDSMAIQDHKWDK
jgi:hypothetical protein